MRGKLLYGAGMVAILHERRGLIWIAAARKLHACARPDDNTSRELMEHSTPGHPPKASPFPVPPEKESTNRHVRAR